MTTTQEARYTFGPLRPTGFLGMTRARSVLAVLFVGAGLVLMNALGGTLGLPIGAGVMAAGAGLVLTRWRGFWLADYLPTWAAGRVRRKRWLHPGPTAAGARISDRPSQLGVPLPAVMDRLAVQVDGSTAFLRQGGEPVGLVDVDRPPAFGLLGAAERNFRTGQWSDVLAGLSRPGSPVARVSWTVRVSPPDRDALRSWQRRHIGPGAHAELAAAYSDLLDTAGPVGQQHVHTLAVRLRSGVLARGARRKAREAGGVGPLVARETAALAGRLDGVAGDAVRPIVRPLELRDRTVSHLDLFRPVVGAPFMAMEEHSDCVRVDRVWWRVLWAETWPDDADAEFLAGLLLACRSPRVVTVHAEPVPAEQARKATRRAAGGLEGDASLWSRYGKRFSAEDRRQLAATLDREEETATGASLIRFTGLVGVAAETREGLGAAEDEVTAAAAGAGVVLRVLFDRQAAALAALMPTAARVNR